MRRLLLRSLVALLAVALVASGATAQQCFAATAHQMAAAAETAHHAMHADHAMHAAHGHMATHKDDRGAPDKHEHSALNCCTMCTTPTVLAASPFGAAVLSVTTIDFPRATHGFTGHIVLVDPGIPKTPV